MEPIQLQLVIPFHQPLSMGRTQLEAACESFYEPFIGRLEDHPDLHVALYFGGHLLDFLTKHREDLLMRVRALHQSGRVEILTGLFYGGLPALLPETDIRGQLEMSFEYWESILGSVPSGFWLPELAWTSEVPRFLSDTEVQYAFGSASQFYRKDDPHRGLGVIERGGHRVAAFVMDDTLSRSLVGADVGRWVDSLVDRAGGEARPAVTVWVEGERLGYELGTRTWAFEHGWLDAFFRAISGGREEVVSVLPAQSFDWVQPVSPLKFIHGCTDAIEADAGNSGPVDWPDFALNFREVDTLARRMLRASDKLQESVATMQEEGLEAEWGGELATVQRLVFSAQTPDAYWRGRRAGCSDPKIRSATYERLIQAEAKMDSLIQGSDDFISEEFDDRDGDLIEEVLIGTRYLTAWLVPSEGGRLRTLDDRLTARTLLDVPARRSETFYHRAGEAPYATDDEIEARGPGGPLDPLPRRNQDLPLEADRSERCGLRDWILDEGASASELFSGSALDLTPKFGTWTEERNEIDEEEDDLTYCLDVSSSLPLAGLARRMLDVKKSVRIPVDAPEVHLAYAMKTEANDRLVYATEIPIRLPNSVMRLDEQVHEPSQSEYFDIKTVEVVAGDDSRVQLVFSRPVDIWADRVNTVVKDVDGYRIEDQGISLVVVSRVDGSTELSIAIRISSGDAGAEDSLEARPTVEMPPVAIQDLGENTDEDEDEYEYEEVDSDEAELGEDEEYEYEYKEVDDDEDLLDDEE